MCRDAGHFSPWIITLGHTHLIKYLIHTLRDIHVCVSDATFKQFCEHYLIAFQIK